MQRICPLPAARRALLVLLVAGGLGLALPGCFSAGNVIEEGMESAAESAGEEVGEAAGRQLVAAADLPPPGSGRWNQVMVTQAQLLFTYAFSAGGMWPAPATYEPGEWAMYRVSATGSEGAALDTLERAFLKTTEDGNEWWRVRGIQDGETWVYEALLDPSTSEVRRLRSRDPNGEVGEVPVTEETVYQPPQRLTEESIEGATEGTEEITTPAGTYTARRVEYQGQMGSGAVTWHLSDEVPGHVVRYQIEGDGEQPWTSTLIDMGTDASTLLNAY